MQLIESDFTGGVTLNRALFQLAGVAVLWHLQCVIGGRWKLAAVCVLAHIVRHRRVPQILRTYTSARTSSQSHLVLGRIIFYLVAMGTHCSSLQLHALAAEFELQFFKYFLSLGSEIPSNTISYWTPQVRCQVAFKSVKIFNQEARMWRRTDDTQTTLRRHADR